MGLNIRAEATVQNNEFIWSVCVRGLPEVGLSDSAHHCLDVLSLAHP